MTTIENKKFSKGDWVYARGAVFGEYLILWKCNFMLFTGIFGETYAYNGHSDGFNMDSCRLATKEEIESKFKNIKGIKL